MAITFVRVFALLLLQGMAMAQPAVTPGPQNQNCLSSFRVGYSNCVGEPVEQKQAPSFVASTPVDTQVQSTTTPDRTGGPTEAEIDAYLANHGKPSRESAKALLDPTDENIAAMARSIRQQAAVASYVAGRLTAMQQVDPGLIAINPSFNSEDLPYLSGMRIVLHVAPNCIPCERATMVLQRLVAESPILDARVVMHRLSDVRGLTLELGRIGVTLPADLATPAVKQFANVVPIAVVADTRFGKEALMEKFGNTQEIRTALVNLRRRSIEKKAK